MAKTASQSASATDIFAFAAETEPLVPGGDLAAARRLSPAAPRPFLDLSTGINPHPYRVPRLPAQTFASLPDADAVAALAKTAAQAYGAPSAAHVVCAPGTQILLPLVSQLVPPSRAAILAPTYGEFARAAALAGHRVVEAREIAEIGDAQLVFIANPNNPDGRLFAKRDLIALGKILRARGGLLIVDEAFMDVGPAGQSLAPEVALGSIVVLRSFGKFFGLAGLRLGFALAVPQLGSRIAGMLGPWAVSGPALATGAPAAGAISRKARCDARPIRARHYRWHQPIPADAYAARERAVQSPRPRRHFGALLCRTKRLAAVRSSGQRASLAAPANGAGRFSAHRLSLRDGCSTARAEQKNRCKKKAHRHVRRRVPATPARASGLAPRRAAFSARSTAEWHNRGADRARLPGAIGGLERAVAFCHRRGRRAARGDPAQF